MRNRHMARECGHCRAPMASGADTCWRCGVAWAPAIQPPARLRLVAPLPTDVQHEPAAAEPALANYIAMPEPVR